MTSDMLSKPTEALEKVNVSATSQKDLYVFVMYL